MAMDQDQVCEHLFEAAGLGQGPFRCVGMFSLPAPSLAGQNPDAYNNALRMMPRGYGCGTCAYCGQAIMHCYLIQSADGQRFAVGSECVLKTGDGKMIRRRDLLRRRAEREAREAERKAKQAIRRREWEAAEQKRQAALQAERDAEHRRLEARRGECTAANSWLIEAMREKALHSPFCHEIMEKLQVTPWAEMGLSDRAVAILRDIFGKYGGGDGVTRRAGSKAYRAAVAEFDQRIGGEQ